MPLNILGFLLKKKTKIPNKLIPPILTFVSWSICATIGYLLNNNIFTILVNYMLVNGTLVTTVATHGWDSSYGIKTILSELMKKDKDFFLDGEKMDILKKMFYKKILNIGLSYLLVLAALSIVIFFQQGSLYSVLYFDYIFTITAIPMICVFDLLEKIRKEPYKLNKQYISFICLVIVGLVFLSFIVLSAMNLIKILASAGLLISIVIFFIVGRYLYLQELIKEPEMKQELLNKQWKVWAKFQTKEEKESAIYDCIISNGYYFESENWGSKFNFQRKVDTKSDSKDALPNNNMVLSVEEAELLYTEETLKGVRDMADKITNSLAYFRSYEKKGDLK